MRSDPILISPLLACEADNARKLNACAEEAGYVYLKGVIPKDSVAGVRRVFEQELIRMGWATRRQYGYALATMPEDPDVTAIQAPVQGSKPFAELRRDPAILTALHHLVGVLPIPGWGDVCRVGIPGMPHWTTPPHQDRSYLKCPGKVWTAWIPLTDCPQELGPLAVLHASHRQGPLKHEHAGPRGYSLEAMDGDWRSTDFSLGDVVLFEDCTIHRALPNRTDRRLRLSVDYRYSDTPV